MLNTLCVFLGVRPQNLNAPTGYCEVHPACSCNLS